ncbi:hypothetical protein Aduo_017290 [Ancylostoma duodenale]
MSKGTAALDDTTHTVFLQLCSPGMVRVYLDPLVNLTSVASILWVSGRCYAVVILLNAGNSEPYEDTVRTLVIIAIILNLMSNSMKFFDSRYLWSFTFPSFVFLQFLMIICEFIILSITASKVDNSAELSFLIDVGYISFMIVFMETTCYIMHRTIRTEEYDAVKKNL